MKALKVSNDLYTSCAYSVSVTRQWTPHTMEMVQT